MTSDEFRIITNNFHRNCAEYGLQTRFNPPKRVRVRRLIYSHSNTKPVNILTASDEIRVLAFDVHLICSEYGVKHKLRKIKKFVCLRFAYCLSVLNMDRKHGSQKR